MMVFYEPQWFDLVDTKLYYNHIMKTVSSEYNKEF